MRFALAMLCLLIARPAFGDDDLVLPRADFAATAIHEAGSFRTRETIHYASGRLRIERGEGFSITIIDLTTRTQCVLMADHTYLILPMDDELFRQFIAASAEARQLGIEQIDGQPTTKFEFGNEGELKAAGTYWLSDSGIMVRREYEDGLFGQNTHHRVFLANIAIGAQPSALFEIPPGYTQAK